MYAVIGEANGQALPLAFLFMRGIRRDKEEGEKTTLIERFLQELKGRGLLATDNPDQFAHSDKDRCKTVAFGRVFRAKRQLCNWHGIKYIRERLAENKPPAHYDPRAAHQMFPFIDPIWAPGIKSGKFVPGGFEESGSEGEGDEVDDPSPAMAQQKLVSQQSQTQEQAN